MHVVFATGGKQYRAAPGDRIKVEKLDVAEGGEIELNQVMMIADGDKITLGEPLIEGSVVTAKVLSHGRRTKIRVIKFRRRKHHKKQMGHRQSFTELEIVGVGAASGGKKAAPVAKKKAEDSEEKAAPKKAAAKKAPAKKASAKKAAAKKAPAKKAAAKKATAKKATTKKAASKKAAAKKAGDE
jgi:large subunit ribosomal protein L21